MFLQILHKEWLKLKYYTLILFFIIFSSLVYFTFNLDFAFKTIEPESMMWYQFAHLEHKPYFYLSYLFILIGIVISFAQFLPEKIQNRIKIMIHLPLSLQQSLSYHLFIGGLLVTILSTLFSFFLLLVLVEYYPDLIVQTALKDTIAYSFTAIIVYIGFSAAILEKNLLISFLKFAFTLLFIGSFLKSEYVIYDTLWVSFFCIIFFLALDSFYSIKQQRITSKLYTISLLLIFSGMLFLNYKYYKQNYSHEFNKYYIFYSNIIDDFVYQKNFGKHQFEYGRENKENFDRTTYESYLPFVYWKNLDIQNQLPLEIKNQSFDKQTIKNSRLGLSYQPKLLRPLEVKLYPLLNPQSNKGMIVFPEEVFSITNKGGTIYTYDDKKEPQLTKEFNDKLFAQKFQFPALYIWGKSTNMKPYDKGYLVLDNEQKLFNIKRVDNIIKISKTPYPKDITLAFVKLSENKQKLLSGYAIDTQSNFYLLDWNFRFIKLDLPNFNYKDMKLKLISNPLNYLIRYDDGKNYYAVVFDKKFQKIKDLSLN